MTVCFLNETAAHEIYTYCHTRSLHDALPILFVLLHKIDDTLANLTFRLLLHDLGFSNTEIATYGFGVGFATMLMGIFVGGILYARIGLKSSVLLSLVLMAVSNLSFAVLAQVGHSNELLAFTMGFENFASGIGGVVVVADRKSTRLNSSH